MKDNYEKELVCSTVIDIKRNHDIISIIFMLPTNIKLTLEITCLVRIFDSGGVLLICSEDLLHPSPSFKTRWHRPSTWLKSGSTMFDVTLDEFKKEIILKKVSKIEIIKNDVILFLENDYRIEVICDATKYDDKAHRDNYKFTINNDGNI